MDAGTSNENDVPAHFIIVPVVCSYTKRLSRYLMLYPEHKGNYISNTTDENEFQGEICSIPHRKGLGKPSFDYKDMVIGDCPLPLWK